jgi:hypothetical protein
MLNDTGCALGRMLATYQQRDGSVKVPGRASHA